MEIRKNLENFLLGKYQIEVSSRTEADYLYEKLYLLGVTWANGNPLNKGYRFLIGANGGWIRIGDYKGGRGIKLARFVPIKNNDCATYHIDDLRFFRDIDGRR